MSAEKKIVQSTLANIQATLRKSAGPTKIQKRKVANQAAKSAADETDISHLSGFGPMTRISASFGEVPAHALRERDMVRTRNGGFAKIERIDRIVLGEGYLQYHPRAQPIMIRAGSLGPNLPKADVMLAPFQPISRQQLFQGQAPKRAIDALDRPAVIRKTEPMITYTVIHCGQPISVLTEGIWVDVAP